jgi:hypothetical protein
MGGEPSDPKHTTQPMVRNDLLVKGPKSFTEVVPAIAGVLGLKPSKHHRSIEAVVRHLGIKRAWGLAIQVMQLPCERRNHAFLALARQHIPPALLDYIPPNEPLPSITDDDVDVDIDRLMRKTKGII